MYKTIKEAIELTNGLKRELFKINSDALDIVLCPPFTALSDVAEVINETGIKLGGQDLYWADEGAFTGEVSGKMLKDVGCSYVIIGHSERRQFFGETNESVNKKIKSALSNGLTPIVCVGEMLAEREAGKTFDILKNHVEGALSGLLEEDVLKIVIAYEPVWAIGTGKAATPQDAHQVISYLRQQLAKQFDKETAEKIRILYGGSVTPENIYNFMKDPDIDGSLVGGASLDPAKFNKIILESLRASQ